MIGERQLWGAVDEAVLMAQTRAIAQTRGGSFFRREAHVLRERGMIRPDKHSGDSGRKPWAELVLGLVLLLIFAVEMLINPVLTPLLFLAGVLGLSMLLMGISSWPSAKNTNTLKTPEAPIRSSSYSHRDLSPRENAMDVEPSPAIAAPQPEEKKQTPAMAPSANLNSYKEVEEKEESLTPRMGRC